MNDIWHGNKPVKLVSSRLSPTHRVDHLTMGGSFLACL